MPELKQKGWREKSCEMDRIGKKGQEREQIKFADPIGETCEWDKGDKKYEGTYQTVYAADGSTECTAGG